MRLLAYSVKMSYELLSSWVRTWSNLYFWLAPIMVPFPRRWTRRSELQRPVTRIVIVSTPSGRYTTRYFPTSSFRRTLKISDYQTQWYVIELVYKNCDTSRRWSLKKWNTFRGSREKMGNQQQKQSENTDKVNALYTQRQSKEDIDQTDSKRPPALLKAFPIAKSLIYVCSVRYLTLVTTQATYGYCIIFKWLVGKLNLSCIYHRDDILSSFEIKYKNCSSSPLCPYISYLTVTCSRQKSYMYDYHRTHCRRIVIDHI